MGNEPHRIALVGAGRMGQIHGVNAAANRRLDLAWLVEPRPDVAADLAGRLGCGLASWEQALADPALAGVIVASSTDTHLDLTLAALRAGNAVFCEKPLDLDLARLRAHEAELRAPQAQLFVAFNRRFDPHFQALKARLDAGAVGAVESLNIISQDATPPHAGFVKTSGGLFRDMAIHDLDMARWLLGEAPSEVFASASCLIDPAIGEAGDVDTARIVLKTPSGRLAMISNSRRSGYGYDQRIEAFGARGMARVDNVVQSTVSTWSEAGATSDRFEPFFLERYAQAYAREMDHFADVLDGAAPKVGLDEAMAALALAEAAETSRRSGSVVRV
ncbi:MAG TPA: inositol 2-dehydrogenase [Caulobacteraceae bacterium]|nr:inositol 2-dehydrogenase [Caulobacteraceae bacterium]